MCKNFKLTTTVSYIKYLNYGNLTEAEIESGIDISFFVTVKYDKMKEIAKCR